MKRKLKEAKRKVVAAGIEGKNIRFAVAEKKSIIATIRVAKYTIVGRRDDNDARSLARSFPKSHRVRSEPDFNAFARKNRLACCGPARSE